MAFEEELDDILRELVREPGVIAAALAKTGEDPFAGETQGGELRRAPLGGGAELVVLVPLPDEHPGVAAALERASREIRALTRMYQREPPALSMLGRAPRTRQALLARIGRYLDAFAATQGAVGVALLRGAQVVATGGALDEARIDRLAFVRKRVDAEAEKQRGKSSHAEVHGDDFFACSFWFDAYLIAFFEGAYALDFVRHRVRLVARELAAILPHLDEPPEAPAKLNPLPE